MSGQTALHHAAERDRPSALALLINAKGSVDAVREHSSRVLCAVVRSSRVRLTGESALCAQVDATGSTPLHLAAFHGHSRIVTQLLAYVPARCFVCVCVVLRCAQRQTDFCKRCTRSAGAHVDANRATRRPSEPPSPRTSFAVFVHAICTAAFALSLFAFDEYSCACWYRARAF